MQLSLRSCATFSNQPFIRDDGLHQRNTCMSRGAMNGTISYPLLPRNTTHFSEGAVRSNLVHLMASCKIVASTCILPVASNFETFKKLVRTPQPFVRIQQLCAPSYTGGGGSIFQTSFGCCYALGREHIAKRAGAEETAACGFKLTQRVALNSAVAKADSEERLQVSMEAEGEDEEHATRSAAGGIHLIVGPMFAGKTTALLKRIQAEVSAGRKAVLVKSEKDARYGLTAVVSHDGMQMPCWTVPSLATFKAQIGEEAYAKLDVIGIDEAQFFKDLYSFCQVAADHEGKTLIVAGLDGDFLRNSFGSALDLIPLADSIVKLSSQCELCGKPAHFTFRKTDDRKTEVIGGADVYMPVCRQHYVSGQFAIETARSVVEVHQVVQRLANVEVRVAETAVKS